MQPKELETLLKKQITDISNSDDSIEVFLNFYKNYKIKHQSPNVEADMILFQYGTYDWQDGNGYEFNFNLTRQFEDTHSDEFYQLSLTLFYDPKRIGEVESFNYWSSDCKDLDTWESKIKSTIGYERSKNIRFRRCEVELIKT